MCGGSHRSRWYVCEFCGHERFHYANEFRDGLPDDKTRICADCGTVEGSMWGAYERDVVRSPLGVCDE
jgi:hypothetical protein